MKGQQLFHTFLPGVTAAVLTTQPALASTVKISGVQLVSPPKVVTSTDGRNLVTNGAMAQHPPEAPATTANVTQTPEEQHSVHSNQPGFQSGSDVATPTFSVKGYGNSNGGSLTSTQQTKDCSKQAQQSRDALLLKPNTCLQKITSVQQIAQATDTPAPATPTPAGATEFTTPAPRGYTTLPENLKPNANPLLYPTKPEEVTIQANQPITLDQAVEIAQRNNNELQVSILELKRSQSALREQQAALFPDLQISADVTNSRSVGSSLSVDRAKNTDPNISDAPSDTSFSGQAQLNYNLYTSGRRLAAIREAEETVRFQELAVENKAEDIRLDVATRYYDLQQADEQVRISQSAVENAQASLRDAQALERAGVGTRFDVLRSQVNLANSQQDLTNAISNQLVARRRLATLLNLPQSINISAADAVQLVGLWNQTLEQSIVLAYQNRAELQQQLLQRNISEQRRKQALAALGPQISLFARYDLLDIFNDNTRVSDGYSLGVRASLNLFDGGAARARAAQAKTNIEIAETQFSEQRNQIRFQVEQAYATQQSNLENVQTANAALEQAKESLRLARLRFQAGVGTQTDVINAENDLTRSEGNRIRAILDYNRALTQLQRYVTFRALRK